MKDKFVVITGSAKGLGKELALVFSKNEYNIILSDIDKKNLNNVKKLILKNNVKCYSVLGDLRNDDTINEIYQIAKKEHVDLLINNAGLHCPHLPIEELNNKQIDNMIGINLIAPMKLTKKIYEYFIKEGKGTIININSLSGLKNHELRSIYSASKWGLRGFSESLKIEAKKKSIRILDVYPSRIKTKKEFKYGMDPEEVAQKIYDTYQNTSIEKIEIDGSTKND
jgi:short-subunit dehydrogenase